MEADNVATALHDLDKLIFDVGMNICEDSAFYLAKGFRVVAIEANPELCQSARERFSHEIDSGRLIVLNLAISDEQGDLNFWVCNEQSAWSTTSSHLVNYWESTRNATFTAVRVESRSIAGILRQYGVPYYAKIDIEGNDLICLRQILSYGKYPQYMSFEVELQTCVTAIRICQECGYNRFSLVAQTAVPTQKPPQPALEGRYINYVFQKGCSGLFGRELPTEWVSADAAIAECTRIARHTRLAGALRRVASAFGLGSVANGLLRSTFPRADNWYDMHVSATLSAPKDDIPAEASRVIPDSFPALDA